MSSHRYENELAQRQTIEADISVLKRLLDELNLKKTELMMLIDTLKEDKVQLQNLHREVMTNKMHLCKKKLVMQVLNVGEN